MAKYRYFVYNEYTDEVSSKFDSLEQAKEEANGWLDEDNVDTIKILEVSTVFSCEMKPIWKVEKD